jgi:hypothetical protein
MKRIFSVPGCVLLALVASIALVLGFIALVIVSSLFSAVDQSGMPQSLERFQVVSKHSSSGGSLTTFVQVGNTLVPLTSEYESSYSLQIQTPDGDRSLPVSRAVHQGKKQGDFMFVKTTKGWMTGKTYYSAP